MANIGKAARRPADAADDDVTDLTGASAGQAMDSTPMDGTPGVSRKRHSTGPSLEMPPCSDCRCPLSGPGAMPYAVCSRVAAATDVGRVLAPRTNPFARAILVSEILGILAPTIFSLLQY
jgi:hypothetical protein